MGNPDFSFFCDLQSQPFFQSQIKSILILKNAGFFSLKKPFPLSDKAQTTETLAPYNPTGRAKKKRKRKNNEE